MDWLVDLYRNELIVFAFVLARVGGLLLAAPMFAWQNLPARLRIGLAILMAAVIAPLHWQSAAAPSVHAAEFVMVIGGELALGVAFGTAVGLLLASAKLAGQLASSLAGFSFTEMGDGSGENSPAFSRLLEITGTALFLAIGGHRQVFAALLNTFQWLPPGQAQFSAAWIEGLVGVATESCELAVRISAPLIVALLLSHLAIAFVSRTVPQLSAMGSGLSLNAMIALATLSLSLGTMVWVFQEQVETTLATIQATLAPFN